MTICGKFKHLIDIYLFISQVWVGCNYAPGGNRWYKKMNVFNPSTKLASACRPGSVKDKSGLCVVKDEKKYRQDVDLDTVPPSKK